MLHKCSENNLLFDRRIKNEILALLLVSIIPFFLAMSVLDLWSWDLTVPLVYSGSDDVWQLILTKALKDTGWILDMPYLGAPDIAHWQFHAAAQTSALHSALMLILSKIIADAVKVQQIYYILNFSLISVSTYLACRLLKIASIAAFSIALLFTFTSYRINYMFYAFLSNYFAVPLAVVPVFWVLIGEFHRDFSSGKSLRFNIGHILRSGKFRISIVCILLVCLSDGYYAFFTLLLLGFATVIRAFCGDVKKPIRLLVPVLLILAMISVALALQMPLRSYKQSHPEEFYIDGKPDTSLIKDPFEAEVYSTSLKLLVSPYPEHRIQKLGQLGKHIVATSDGARKFPTGKTIVPLGSIGTLLFLSLLLMPAIMIISQISYGEKSDFPTFIKENKILWAAVILSVFIFLSSIAGGIGTLVALIYPTVRAYDRFPLFMLFCLFAGAGAALNELLKSTSKTKIAIGIAIAVVLTSAGLYDQIPNTAAKGSAKTRHKFLAERNFVSHVESILPRASMIYNYPHSQFLSDSKHYGWGSFSHIRLYLHSNGIHWSNGASKNSAVENWHNTIANLPVSELITELKAVGFRGFMIDRTVVPESQYQALREVMNSHGIDVMEDAASELAFGKLNDPGYQIFYDRNYLEIEKLTITDNVRLSQSEISRWIEKKALLNLLSQKEAVQLPMVLKRTDNPEIMRNAEIITKGNGTNAIRPLEDMKGQLTCKLEGKDSTALQTDTVRLTLHNLSAFDWYLDHGRFPIRIGMHLRKLDGTLIRWDDGFRVPANGYVRKDGSVQFSLPLSKLDLSTGVEKNSIFLIEFALVQDGHAWFSQISDRVTVQTF